jgi:UDP-3-O-[3-hydroxymyristoyl] N-acetylglucosamine deacetylase
MRANGLALGGGLDNAIVMDDTKVLNADGLRYATSSPSTRSWTPSATCTASATPCWRPTAPRSGHALNNQLLRALLAQADAWELVSFEHARQAPAGFAELARAW